MDELEKILYSFGDAGPFVRALFPHIRYDRAFAVLSRGGFNGPLRKNLKPLAPAGFGRNRLSEDLARRGVEGPTFPPVTLVERVADRYKFYDKKYHLTVPKLARKPIFQNLVGRLRDAGWKDWHILLSLGNLIANCRLAECVTSDEASAIFDEVMRFEAEKEAFEIDEAMLTEDIFAGYLHASAGATLQSYGLEHKLAFSDEELMSLLASRYTYWNVDAPHDDPFAQGVY